MKKTILLKSILILVAITTFMGCYKAEDEDYTEPVKDISGDWQVVEAYRNDENITDLMNFSQFMINFSADGSYSFQNYLPFIISEEGTWSLNDPQYPNYISFAGNSGQEAIQSQLALPITDGKRQISITFSPGCPENSYTYVFERVATQ